MTDRVQRAIRRQNLGLRERDGGGGEDWVLRFRNYERKYARRSKECCVRFFIRNFSEDVVFFHKLLFKRIKDILLNNMLQTCGAYIEKIHVKSQFLKKSVKRFP